MDWAGACMETTLCGFLGHLSGILSMVMGVEAEPI